MPRGKGKATMISVMKDFKAGGLHSGSKNGPVVTNPKQAIAIGISESKPKKAKKTKKTKMPKMPMGSPGASSKTGY